MIYIICVIGLLLTQVGDYLTTKKALKRPGAFELNPIVRRMGLLPSKLAISTVFLYVGYVCWKNGNDVELAITTVIICCAYLWVSFHNMKIAKI